MPDLSPDYPNDADGDTLRRIAEDGSDMTAPMELDFVVTVADESAAAAVGRAAEARGYRVLVEQDGDANWACLCSRTMVATHASVLAAQKELDELAAPHGGKSDGWGSFGNV